MPDPFLTHVEAELNTLADQIAALREQQKALTPRIFTLEQQQKALQAYRQTIAQAAPAKASRPELTQEEFADELVALCLMHSGGFEISHAMEQASPEAPRLKAVG